MTQNLDRFKARLFRKTENLMAEVRYFDVKRNMAMLHFSDAISIEIQLSEGILMQCTGLKDKNGKLIYEGDVIKFEVDGECFYDEVTWYDDGYFGVCDGETALGNFIDYDMIKGIDYDMIKGIVCGNIYENPELLEKID